MLFRAKYSFLIENIWLVFKVQFVALLFVDFIFNMRRGVGIDVREMR